MPFKTPHGTHYHMTEGCCGAFERCDTKGLAPCSRCCGSGSQGTGAGSPQASSSAGGGAPTLATQGPTTESMEAADRWRQSATAALFSQPARETDRSKVVVGRRSHYVRDEDGRRHDVTDWIEYADGHKEIPGADGTIAFVEAGGRTFTYDEWEARRGQARRPAVSPEDVKVSGAIAQEGVMGLSGPSSMPGGVDAAAVASGILRQEPYGSRRNEWDEGTQRVAEEAKIPADAVCIGKVGSLTIFETSHTSTQNPDDPSDRRGGWLYDIREAHVVTPDGIDLAPTMHTALSLREAMGRAEERFMAECRREAEAAAWGHRNEIHAAERQRAIGEARRRYEAEVVAQWQAGYDAWRAEHEPEAQRMADDMRRSRPEWRHRYIASDVEDRMSRAYQRENPKPRQWGVGLPEHQAAERLGDEATERRLAEEGWDQEAEAERALVGIIARRDPQGLRGVSPAMRRNYDDAMAHIRRYPGAEGLMGRKLVWGASLGSRVRLPDDWRDAADGQGGDE